MRAERKARLGEASGLCFDIVIDLVQVKFATEAGNAERALEFLAHIQDVLLDPLHDHIAALREHAANQAKIGAGE